MMNVVLYYACGDDGVNHEFTTREDMAAWQEAAGMWGGEIEHKPALMLYRCPDFDNEWRHFGSNAEAFAYYDSLAA